MAILNFVTKKNIFLSWRWNTVFSETENLKEFITGIPALQEMLKEIPQMKLLPDEILQLLGIKNIRKGSYIDKWMSIFLVI